MNIYNKDCVCVCLLFLSGNLRQVLRNFRSIDPLFIDTCRCE